MGIDTSLACVVRTDPSAGEARLGAVGPCTDPTEAPQVELLLAPGRHVLQVGRFACPGMPSECPDDAYDDEYQLDAALWSCEVTVVLSTDEVRRVGVRVPDEGRRVRCS